MQKSKLYSLLFIYLTILKYLLLAFDKNEKYRSTLLSCGEKGYFCTQLRRDGFLLYIQRKNNINKKSASSIQKSLKSCKLLFTLYIPTPAQSRPPWHVRRLRLILHPKPPEVGVSSPPQPCHLPLATLVLLCTNSDACASIPAPTAGLGTDPKPALAGNPILHFTSSVSFSTPVPGRSQDAPSVPRPLSHKDAASSFLGIHGSAGILAGWEGHTPTTSVSPWRPTELCQMVSPRDPPFG